MPNHSVKTPHTATFSAVITRADGTVEDVGLVAAGYENPIRQFWWDHVGQKLTKRRIRNINSRHLRTD